MELTARVITITPELAKEYLSKNTMNRQLSHAQVRLYARMMRDEKWMLIPAPIIRSKDLILLQGQHRLSAVIESGLAQKFLICEGVDKEIFPYLDAGMSRSGSDALFIEGGFTHPELYASLILQYMKWVNHTFWGHGNKAEKPTSIEVLEYAIQNKEDLAVTVNFAKNLPKRTTYITERQLCTSCHIISHSTKSSLIEVQDFFREFSATEEEECRESLQWLRDEMLANKESTRKLQYQQIYAAIFYAWNHKDGKFLAMNPDRLKDVIPV